MLNYVENYTQKNSKTPAITGVLRIISHKSDHAWKLTVFDGIIVDIACL